ncbi:hypothetical protein [Thiohalophilus thiocyanatoxydans]|uniref:CopG-like ribbon-helix-helix domain-containing protein n=1 Tax=Thiohalophilus thiocyanatoxydans TaxID=381308 RepID=A0A4R8IP61_9GAMM|nr:hypothetical protein [Thiohalophilus thiocyanatoxydans]TDY02702.1 hypothetical protein EDC23_1079 [Thiohalophilus thiocyanatoxydans]
MSQLHFYVPDEIEKKLREQARQTGQPLSRYLANLIQRQLADNTDWPPGYFETVYGGWEGEEPLRRTTQGDYEQRPGLE